MDPITAVGFAASILTFIDFGYKLVTGTLEVLKTGSLSENTHVSIIINDFHAVVGPLAQQPTGKSGHEIALRDLAKRCQDISQKLTNLLQTLKTDPKRSSWKSVKVVLRSMWKKGEVVDLEDQLCSYRSEIMVRLVAILSERQLSLQVQLSDFQSQVQKQSSDATEQLQKLRSDILDAVEYTLRQTSPPPHQEDPKETCVKRWPAEESKKDKLSIEDQLQLIQAIRENLDDVLLKKGPSPEIRVLKQLYFTSLYQRKNDLHEAGAKTFEWILGHPTEQSEEDPEEVPKEGLGELAQNNASGKRDAAASRFLHWLRNGNGVFHISGKAGSGKSTMMKLILEDEKTRHELDQWAGEKELVFAQFFFWSSGVQLQCSLDGLYRSILFEILIQCPDLIRSVFPRAYSAFSKNRLEESIDEIFFGSTNIRRAFEDLITRSPQPGYRFCLFIDGLDEYGGDAADEWEQQQLADTLNTWAAQEDVKILASSRPHREFENTFSDELRIRLHELTRSDIVLAGRQMFENNKYFKRRPEIQDCYVDLVEKVADGSDGVFLWASLAIRALLNALGRYDPIDSLEEQLQRIPRNFNKLYEKIFMSIDPGDQVKAFKLLLLVAELPAGIGLLNALTITWLKDLDNPEFPMNCAFKPYADREIERRHLEAKCQIDSLTKGLLEITTWERSSLFCHKRVQFFHRTVRDFVRQSQAIQEFATRLPDFTDISNYARLVLAELYFGRTEDIESHHVVYSNILWGYEYRFPDDDLLDAYGRAYEHHNKSSGQSKGQTVIFCGAATKLRNSRFGREYGAQSNLHFMATAGFVGYVQRKVTANPDLLCPQGEMSLLLSVSMNWRSAVVKALLDAGTSPHDVVLSLQSQNGLAPAEFTIWQLVCTAFACRVLQVQDRSKVRSCYEILQYFLEAGVDFNCYALLARKKNPTDDSPRPTLGTPTHAIHLRTLVQQLDPPNLGELLRLMEEHKPPRSVFGVVGATWEYLTGGVSSATTTVSFQPQDYVAFDLAMDPYTLWGNSGEEPLFFVTAVHCEGELVSSEVCIKFL